MKALGVLVVILALNGLFVEAKYKKLKGPRVKCSGPTCIKFQKSGKFSVSRGNQSEDAKHTITIEFDSIKEVDTDGNEVGKSGPRAGRHSFNNFANLDFNFSDIVNTTYKGIEATAFNFTAKLDGPNATLNVPIYFFKENGTLHLCDDEEISIVRGVMKYNIELSNWNFCKAGSGCGNKHKEEIGKYVDFVITVKNKGKAVKGKKKGKKGGMKHKSQKVYFGNGTSISTPNAISSDGKCIEMPENFPDLKIKNNKYSITFRFPKFNDQILYDPAVNVIDSSAAEELAELEATTATPSVGTVSKTLLSLPAVLILGALVRLFF